MVDDMEKEAKRMRTDTLNICWHMRGGISYTEAMHLSPNERGIIAEMIKEHLDTTKKSGLPYF
jgi:hypothetical protein